MNIVLSIVWLFCLALFQGAAPKPATPSAAEPAVNELSPEWFGRWTGTLIIPGAKEMREVPLEMIIQPIKGERAYEWTSIFGSGDKKASRNYKLVPQEKNNTFVIDEGDGVLLDCRMVGNVLLSQFRVGDILLSSREELRDGKLYREVVTFYYNQPRVTGQKGDNPGVQSYPMQAIQYATLTKASSPAR